MNALAFALSRRAATSQALKCMHTTGTPWLPGPVAQRVRAVPLKRSPSGSHPMHPCPAGPAGGHGTRSSRSVYTERTSADLVCGRSAPPAPASRRPVSNTVNTVLLRYCIISARHAARLTARVRPGLAGLTSGAVTPGTRQPGRRRSPPRLARATVGPGRRWCRRATPPIVPRRPAHRAAAAGHRQVPACGQLRPVSSACNSAGRTVRHRAAAAWPSCRGVLA